MASPYWYIVVMNTVSDLLVLCDEFYHVDSVASKGDGVRFVLLLSVYVQHCSHAGHWQTHI